MAEDRDAVRSPAPAYTKVAHSVVPCVRPYEAARELNLR
ncbi:MAG: hypothetical protein JWM76_2300 [Pseudonocardiales bacterium]|nr:hypothetical protein [Pseudonocardiales bacterium]